MSELADSLPDDPATLKAMLLAERTRAERLAQIIKEMQRHRFGRRAETLSEDQLLLGFEEAEQTAADEEAGQEMKVTGRAGSARRQAPESYA
jgi:transposase